MPKNDPSRTYNGVFPLLLEFLVSQPIGAEFSYEKLASETGFTFNQVRTSLRHAADSGRLNLTPIADGLGVAWMGLGPNAKLADRDRMARAPKSSAVVGTATEAIPANGTGEVRLLPPPSGNGVWDPHSSPARRPVGEYLSTVPVDAAYLLVRELKDGALLLEDGDGELYKAVRI